MEEKRIKKWKTATSERLGAVYLRDMAEQGMILEDMSHLMYIFREGEPQYLRYRMETRERALTEEERAAYAKDGWREVCHYELEYVFVKERDPFTEEPEVDQQELVVEIDKQLKEEKKNMGMHKIFYPVLFGFFIIILFMNMGTKTFSGPFLQKFLINFGPTALIAFLGSIWSIRRLKKKKERVLEGDIPKEYTDWRMERRTIVFLVTVLIIGLGIWIFYASDFNEKTFDLPQEISYEKIPAVRLEMLTDEKLVRAGESIDMSKKGIRLNAASWEGNMYDIQKEMGGFENYGIDYRYLLKTKEKVETRQCMQTENGTELNLDTMYYRFRSGVDAVTQYDSSVKKEEEMKDVWEERGIEVPSPKLVFVETDAFLRKHICKKEYSDETVYHIVCQGEEHQIMELWYSGGDVTVEQLMAEIDKVFKAQIY